MRKVTRIGVTGASGFVGSWVMRRLTALSRTQPIEVVSLLGRPPSQVDVTDGAAVEREIERAHPTAVIHLAAVASPPRAQSDPRHAWDVNVMGTLNVAEAVLKHCPEAKFIFASSSEAYGLSFNAQTSPLNEDAPLNPISTYGATKAAADILIGQLATRGLRAIRFRSFNHTGPGQSTDFVVSAFARQVADIESGRQEPIIRVGNLAAERDFLDVRDVVDAYIASVLSEDEATPGTALNLSTGQPVSVGHILNLLLASTDVGIEVREDPQRVRVDRVLRVTGDSARAKSILGWYPRIPLERTVLETLDFWRSYPHPAADRAVGVRASAGSNA